jgi:hypothetical protein
VFSKTLHRFFRRRHHHRFHARLLRDLRARFPNRRLVIDNQDVHRHSLAHNDRFFARGWHDFVL